MVKQKAGARGQGPPQPPPCEPRQPAPTPVTAGTEGGSAGATRAPAPAPAADPTAAAAFVACAATPSGARGKHKAKTGSKAKGKGKARATAEAAANAAAAAAAEARAATGAGAEAQGAPPQHTPQPCARAGCVPGASSPPGSGAGSPAAHVRCTLPPPDPRLCAWWRRGVEVAGWRLAELEAGGRLSACVVDAGMRLMLDELPAPVLPRIRVLPAGLLGALAAGARGAGPAGAPEGEGLSAAEVEALEAEALASDLLAAEYVLAPLHGPGTGPGAPLPLPAPRPRHWSLLVAAHAGAALGAGGQAGGEGKGAGAGGGSPMLLHLDSDEGGAGGGGGGGAGALRCTGQGHGGALLEAAAEALRGLLAQVAAAAVSPGCPSPPPDTASLLPLLRLAPRLPQQPSPGGPEGGPMALAFAEFLAAANPRALGRRGAGAEGVFAEGLCPTAAHAPAFLRRQPPWLPPCAAQALRLRLRRALAGRLRAAIPGSREGRTPQQQQALKSLAAIASSRPKAAGKAFLSPAAHAAALVAEAAERGEGTQEAELAGAGAAACAGTAAPGAAAVGAPRERSMKRPDCDPTAAPLPRTQRAEEAQAQAEAQAEAQAAAGGGAGEPKVKRRRRAPDAAGDLAAAAAPPALPADTDGPGPDPALAPAQRAAAPGAARGGCAAEAAAAGRADAPAQVAEPAPVLAPAQAPGPPQLPPTTCTSRGDTGPCPNSNGNSSRERCASSASGSGRGGSRGGDKSSSGDSSGSGASSGGGARPGGSQAASGRKGSGEGGGPSAHAPAQVVQAQAADGGAAGAPGSKRPRWSPGGPDGPPAPVLASGCETTGAGTRAAAEGMAAKGQGRAGRGAAHRAGEGARGAAPGSAGRAGSPGGRAGGGAQQAQHADDLRGPAHGQGSLVRPAARCPPCRCGTCWGCAAAACLLPGWGLTGDTREDGGEGLAAPALRWALRRLGYLEGAARAAGPVPPEPQPPNAWWPRPRFPLPTPLPHAADWPGLAWAGGLPGRGARELGALAREAARAAVHGAEPGAVEPGGGEESLEAEAAACCVGLLVDAVLGAGAGGVERADAGAGAAAVGPLEAAAGAAQRLAGLLELGPGRPRRGLRGGQAGEGAEASCPGGGRLPPASAAALGAVQALAAAGALDASLLPAPAPSTAAALHLADSRLRGALRRAAAAAGALAGAALATLTGSGERAGALGARPATTPSTGPGQGPAHAQAPPHGGRRALVWSPQEGLGPGGGRPSALRQVAARLRGQAEAAEAEAGACAPASGESLEAALATLAEAVAAARGLEAGRGKARRERCRESPAVLAPFLRAGEPLAALEGAAARQLLRRGWPEAHAAAAGAEVAELLCAATEPTAGLGAAVEAAGALAAMLGAHDTVAPPLALPGAVLPGALGALLRAEAEGSLRVPVLAARLALCGRRRDGPGQAAAYWGALARLLGRGAELLEAAAASVEAAGEAGVEDEEKEEEEPCRSPAVEQVPAAAAALLEASGPASGARPGLGAGEAAACLDLPHLPGRGCGRGRGRGSRCLGGPTMDLSAAPAAGGPSPSPSPSASPSASASSCGSSAQPEAPTWLQRPGPGPGPEAVELWRLGEVAELGRSGAVALVDPWGPLPPGLGPEGGGGGALHPPPPPPHLEARLARLLAERRPHPTQGQVQVQQVQQGQGPPALLLTLPYGFPAQPSAQTPAGSAAAARLAHARAAVGSCLAAGLQPRCPQLLAVGGLVLAQGPGQEVVGVLWRTPPGPTLQEALRRLPERGPHPRSGGAAGGPLRSLPLPALAGAVADAACACAALAERGLVHGRVGCGAVLLVEGSPGCPPRGVLGDYGALRAVGSQAAAACTRGQADSHDCLPPEALLGPAPAPAWDAYGLGSMLLGALLGPGGAGGGAAVAQLLYPGGGEPEAQGPAEEAVRALAERVAVRLGPCGGAAEAEALVRLAAGALHPRPERRMTGACGGEEAGRCGAAMGAGGGVGPADWGRRMRAFAQRLRELGAGGAAAWG
ncbi:hypothetical protein HYH03_015105 [Edaphochlamys debaryana]|uniref:Protein kinase domain-containing protein n=1 Tax=Edaphochlamys debaryana TaxID=47281 RepID=A0A835XPY7_9CHLO|nr:hypothetical protein HYH03_015105 [Edaphochlamys debaryana]|eukprot:KAG2486141.1 hypothetical protein HYH03_015105 [Edaphochlamys debaryana]